MVNNYPYTYAQPPRQGIQPFIKGHPVTSFDEARASMIDFDGTIFYFPDAANQKIYTKQINLDGTPSIKVYELAKEQPMNNNTNNFVTKEELKDTINNLVSQMKNAGTAVEFNF